MNYQTPPSTPSRTSFHTPPRAIPTPHTQHIATIPQSVGLLGQRLTLDAGSGVVPRTHASTIGTPGTTSAEADPINQQQNDIHKFPKGLVTYRGDNSYSPQHAKSYCAQFFTLEKEIAESQYGKLVLKFKLKQDIRLLRLDKNAEGFHDWLKKTDQFTDNDKNILYQNFGYPKTHQINGNPNEQPRSRESVGDKDRTMLNMIQAYSEKPSKKLMVTTTARCPMQRWVATLKVKTVQHHFFMLNLPCLMAACSGNPHPLPTTLQININT